jgi:hypothetical protein
MVTSRIWFADPQIALDGVAGGSAKGAGRAERSTGCGGRRTDLALGCATMAVLAHPLY